MRRPGSDGLFTSPLRLVFRRMGMRLKIAGLMLVATLVSLESCGPYESEEQRHHDANTPAGKAGQAAHKAAVQLDKAGRVIGRKLDKAAHDAREGWNEDAHKDRDKK